MTSVATTTVQTVLNNDYASLYYYPEHKIVRHEFHRYMHGQEFRRVMLTGVELLEQHGANKWLSDDRKNSALPTEDGIWMTTDWSPRAFGAGWRYWALIMPDKIAGQKTMNRILKQTIDRGLVIQVFEDTDEAMRWLESV